LKTIVCIGTGPSLQAEQIQSARSKGFELYACNNAIFMAEDATLLYGCNHQWWDHYWSKVEHLPCEKWTTSAMASARHPINWINEKNAPGLSDDPSIIHHGHGSGYSLVSMAFRNGADRIILLGYDLKYAPNYNGPAREIGSEPRHFFGEYPASMVHWPSKMVQKGVHVELLDLYRSIEAQGLVEVINCTPGSAIDCFETVDIESVQC
jgi:hypothetical protein